MYEKMKKKKKIILEYKNEYFDLFLNFGRFLPLKGPFLPTFIQSLQISSLLPFLRQWGLNT